MSVFAQGTKDGPAEDGLVRWLFARTHIDRDAALEADIAYLTRTLPAIEARLERLTPKHKKASR